MLVFCGLTAWDTQRIKDTYVEYAGTEVEDKLTVMNAFGLYVNFVAIFQALIQLTGHILDFARIEAMARAKGFLAVSATPMK